MRMNHRLVPRHCSRCHGITFLFFAQNCVFMAVVDAGQPFTHAERNHLEERLLDQARARALYIPPPFWGSFA